MTELDSDAAQLEHFFDQHRSIVVITGAGISASCGIPTYRDQAGNWRHSEPIRHQDFVTQQQQRKRYWTRSLLGWPMVRDARPNAGHLALARLERQGRINLLITQNVDRLHQRAGSERVVDLHGRLDQVRCLHCDAVFSREQVQQSLLRDNPQVVGRTRAPKPDGDADVAEALVSGFCEPACADCDGTLMPDVVFFGGAVPSQRVQACSAAIEGADAVLAIGSSLQVFSGFRFCRLASQLGKPLALINPGQTRADPLASLKLESKCEALLASAVVTAGARPGSGV